MTYILNFAGEDTIAKTQSLHDARTVAQALVMAQGFKDEEIEFETVGDGGRVYSVYGWKDNGQSGSMVMIYNID